MSNHDDIFAAIRDNEEAFLAATERMAYAITPGGIPMHVDGQAFYDEDKFFQFVKDSEYVLTPPPEKLTPTWYEGPLYFFDELSDTSSLAWIDVIIVTYREQFPGELWQVDYPGMLYTDDGKHEEAESSPFDMQKMQDVADLTLQRYRALFDRLVAAGVPVEEEE